MRRWEGGKIRPVRQPAVAICASQSGAIVSLVTLKEGRGEPWRVRFRGTEVLGLGYCRRVEENLVGLGLGYCTRRFRHPERANGSKRDPQEGTPDKKTPEAGNPDSVFRMPGCQQ